MDMNFNSIQMLILLMLHMIQSNVPYDSSSDCNTSSFFVMNVEQLKSTRPLNISFSKPIQRCSLIFSTKPQLKYFIMPNCTVLSNGTTYVREVYNQSNSIDCDLDYGDYYVYAFNCISTFQEPYNISMSWTKIDAIYSFISTSWLYAIYIITSILLFAYLPVVNSLWVFLFTVVVYKILNGAAIYVLHQQEAIYRESIVEHQKGNLVIWAIMNSFILTHMLFFIIGFKTGFHDYYCSHILKIFLASLLSLALNLFNSLSYFYFDLNSFLITSMVFIPITVIIELVPFVILWVRLSRELKEVCSKLCSKNLSNPNFDINQIYSYFHAHNAVGLSLILIQSLTPMYVYFYNLNTDTYIAAAFTHFVIPELLLFAMHVLIVSIYCNFDSSPTMSKSKGTNLNDLNDHRPERNEENDNYTARTVDTMVQSSLSMAVRAYNAAKAAYDNMVSTFPNYHFESTIPLLDNNRGANTSQADEV